MLTRHLSSLALLVSDRAGYYQPRFATLCGRELQI